MMIYSSSYIYAADKFNDPYFFLKKHLVFLFLGIFITYLASKIDSRKYRPLLGVFFWITIIILILTLIPSLGIKIKGARRWLNLGFFRVQTSELAKLMIIFFLAHYYDKKNQVKDSFINYVLLPLLVLFCVAVLIILQPDFSTLGLIVIIAVLMMFIAGAKFIHLFVYLGLPLILIIVSAVFLAPYRFQRIISFLDPWKDPEGAGFQIIQSMLAIYNGSWLGSGIGNSKLKLHYLPEAHNDFIFSIIAEEFGFLGSSIIILLFFMLIFNGLKIASSARDLFSKYLAFGIVFSIGIQAFINIYVTLGLVPVTGLPLPFVSYGGASFLTFMFMFGIMLNIAAQSD